MEVIKNHPMDDLETLNRRARLRELIELCFNSTTADLIRHITQRTGKTPNQGELSLIQRDNSGKSFGDKKAKGLTEMIGLHRRWFDFPIGTNTDRADWLKEPDQNKGNSTTPPRPVYTWTNEDELREGDILIPALELKLSAGHGETVFEVDRKGRGRAFQKDYLERMEINPDCAATMVVSGNSMGPRLIDGDSILVDYCRQTILDGRVYAFVWQEEYFIKRIFKESGGALRLQSDNPDKTLYPDRLITTEHLHEFRLIGQVVGLVGGKI